MSRIDLTKIDWRSIKYCYNILLNLTESMLRRKRTSKISYSWLHGTKGWSNWAYLVWVSFTRIVLYKVLYRLKKRLVFLMAFSRLLQAACKIFFFVGLCCKQRRKAGGLKRPRKTTFSFINFIFSFLHFVAKWEKRR